MAAGNKWVAVASSINHLRMFTARGLQRKVVMVMGPLVNMMGEGHRLMVVTHRGHPLTEVIHLQDSIPCVTPSTQ